MPASHNKHVEWSVCIRYIAEQIYVGRQFILALIRQLINHLIMYTIYSLFDRQRQHQHSNKLNKHFKIGTYESQLSFCTYYDKFYCKCASPDHSIYIGPFNFFRRSMGSTNEPTRDESVSLNAIERERFFISIMHKLYKITRYQSILLYLTQHNLRQLAEMMIFASGFQIIKKHTLYGVQTGCPKKSVFSTEDLLYSTNKQPLYRVVKKTKNTFGGHFEIFPGGN